MIGCKRVFWINSCSVGTRAPSVLEFYFLVPSKKGQSRQTPAGLAINRATLSAALLLFFPTSLQLLFLFNSLHSTA